MEPLGDGERDFVSLFGVRLAAVSARTAANSAVVVEDFAGTGAAAVASLGAEELEKGDNLPKILHFFFCGGDVGSGGGGDRTIGVLGVGATSETIGFSA